MTRERDDLAASGYAWEIADAPVLHDALNLADLEHALELREIGALTDTDAVTLIRGLLMMHDIPCEEVGYDPSHGELVTSREAYLADRIGDVAGYLRAGRTRREAVRTAFRIVVRRQALDLVVDACELATTVCDRSEEHARTLMPDYTYLQPAQASTFGHYLLSFADPVLRDAQRLMAEYANVNQSPAGSGAANGSPLIKDREGAAEALGFSAPAEHIRDAMWQTDPFSHVLFLATSLVLAEDRLAEDLEIFASREFDFVALADNVVRPSVLMPQKRNPYALTVVRGSAGIMIGRLTGQLALAKAPSARSDTFIYAYGEVPRALDLAGRVTRLLGSVIAGLDGADRISLVGHSLGNIVVRRWMAEAPAADLDRIERMVMLGAPNQGSDLARRVSQVWLLSKLSTGAARDLVLDWPRIARNLAVPPCPFGIIAGGAGDAEGYSPMLEGDDDSVVRVDETRLDGSDDFLLLPVRHAFMMRDPAVQEATASFLKGGRFGAPAADPTAAAGER